MRIGVTIRFQNSYFSGGIPQVACALSRTLAAAGHDVTLLYPKGESAWFIDVQSMAANLPPRREWSSDQSYDAIVEVVWALPPDERKAAARNVISFVHHPPIFHDIESSVYNWNPTKRSFENLSAIWTYDMYSEQDTHYLEFLSGVPVYKVPYMWDADFLDAFVKENGIPEWTESAARVEKALPSHLPKTIAWSARVLESNFSNTSHCVIPLNIISQIRAKGDHVRFTVHNGENTANNNFFKSNIANNLLLPDISGNMVPRVRLPDLRREKVFIIGHQRFRPIKNYLLDALYLGIPMVHNCMMVKTLGAPYYYELNQIQQAQEAWKTLAADYEASTGFFNPKAHAVRQSMLRVRFGPAALASKYDALLKKPMGIVAPRVAPTLTVSGPELRVAFCKMWDDFQPKYNFFMYLLAWIGKQNGIRVVHDDVNPNLVFFGPLSDDGHKYPGVPKVYYTGENAPPNRAPDTILNIGFNYDTSPNYIRLPLWVLEINWWNGNVDKMVNPKPVALKDAMTVDPALLDSKQKFCAFVATNPTQQNRNAAFHILNRWRGVDAGGRLFCNLPGGPIPAGRGGGGGELAKLEFYKKYKFALTFENSASPGYTTEKLFHAKVAGCVPIYWGDQFVDRDFDSRGFINANQASTPEALIQLVDKIASNPDEWRKMAAVPALSEFKKRWCEKTMEEVARYIFKRVLGKDTKDAAWDTAAAFGAEYESADWGTQPIATPVVEPITQVTSAGTQQPPSLKVSDLNPSTKRVFVTATNAKFVESAVNVLASLRNYEPTIEKIVYVWPDVKPEHIAALQHCGATSVRMLPTTVASETPWADFWEPKHYAWKLWVHNNMIQEAEFDTSILYLDAGVAIAAPLDRIWKQIDERGVFLLDDDQQTNVRWCHPRFCEIIQATPDELAGNQITGGLIGYKKGHPNVIIAEKALAIARDHRDAIVGEKWSPYSAVCMGHRHDQSILSVLTHRAGAPRLPLREFYTDKSMRDARMRGLPLYVHRGQYREMVQFADGIDEAYVINLDRRPDRMTRFGESHGYMKDRVYRWSATDGKSIALTPELTHLFRNNDFNWKKAVMGCALSHMRLWEKLANDKVAKRYLILEDDVKFGDKWLVQWMQSVKHIPEDADVIYLGGILPPNKAAFPQAIEKVNDWFGRVGLNTVFSPPGAPPRKYFHFCNYAYILTQTGARKLMHIIQQAGIFTSGDHMIVNNGSFLNIYFTTPLVATCFQEDDPVYQRSEFNNFERVDNFDSDLWNNTDKFSPEEVQAAAAAKDIRPPAHSNIVTTAAPAAAATAAPTHEEAIQVWNNFLRQIAFKHEVADSLESIFRIWNAQTADEFNKNLNWFRIFEKLIEQKNPAVMKHATRITALIGPLAANQDKGGQALWSKVLAAFDAPAPAPAPPSDKQVIYYMPPINPNGIYETEWLSEIFQKPVEWKLLENSGQLAEPALPVLLMQNIPGRSLRDFMPLFDVLEMMNKKVIVLHLSDEHGRDDIEFYGKSSVKHVLRNYWRPNLDAYSGKVTIIPLGYTNERSGTTSSRKSFADRTYVWGFAGSADREGRPQALQAMRKVTPFRESTKATWSIPNMLNGKQYGEMMDDVKFAPCFRGMWALESYRLYEALEHGAIPIYIPSESHGVEDEWKAMYGPHPILGFPSWEKAAEMLPMLMKQTDVMERHRASLQEWWSKKKAEVKQHIASLLA